MCSQAEEPDMKVCSGGNAIKPERVAGQKGQFARIVAQTALLVFFLAPLVCQRVQCKSTGGPLLCSADTICIVNVL